MRANLLSLALGTVLLSALSACSVNYYVGGTRYAAPAPQPGYNYDYPAPAPQPGPVATGPVRTPPPAQPPVRNPQPPIRTQPPVRTPPVRNPQPTSPPAHPGNGTILLPTAPPKPAPGPTKQPDLLPTAPPKPAPGQVLPGPHQVPGPTKQPDLLPTAPPKPMPPQPGASTQQPVRQPETIKQPELLPTAPPKPMPPQPGASTQQPVREPEPIKQPELLPTAPPKPAPDKVEQPAESAPVQVPAQSGPRKRGNVRGAETPLGLNDGAPAQSAGAPVLVFRKTPCFGLCPHFEASIYADGRVHYVGHRNVDKVGTYELQIPVEVVRAITQQADEIGFANFKDQYLSGATDMASTYLTYNRPGQPGKTVQVEDGAPAELMGLLTYINREIGRIGAGTGPGNNAEN